MYKYRRKTTKNKDIVVILQQRLGLNQSWDPILEFESFNDSVTGDLYLELLEYTIHTTLLQGFVNIWTIRFQDNRLEE